MKSENFELLKDKVIEKHLFKDAKIDFSKTRYKPDTKTSIIIRESSGNKYVSFG